MCVCVCVCLREGFNVPNFVSLVSRLLTYKPTNADVTRITVQQQQYLVLSTNITLIAEKELGQLAP